MRASKASYRIKARRFGYHSQALAPLTGANAESGDSFAAETAHPHNFGLCGWEGLLYPDASGKMLDRRVAYESLKTASVAFTVVSILATGWLQYEKFRLDGEWQLDTCTTDSEFVRYRNLHLAWRVFISDDALSASVVGDGEKIREAFARISRAARFPVRLVGTKEINSVSLTARFEGARRTSTGRFEFEPTHSRRMLTAYIPFYQRHVDVMKGTFTLTAGNARGRVRAVRLIDGRLPENIPPFTCGAFSADSPPPSPRNKEK